MKPPEETVDTTDARLHEALGAFRASRRPAPTKRAAKKAATPKAALAGDSSQAAAPAKPHGRPVFAGKPYDATSTKLYLVVIEDENATKGSYAIDYLEEPDAVVVGVREISLSRPDPAAKPDPRRPVLRTLRVVKLPKIMLDEPLGERPLLDAATGKPVEVWAD